LTEQGSKILHDKARKLHDKSLNRLLKANTALAEKRLAFTQALHDGLGAGSPLAELVERELFRSIAESR